ncbi:unnamed protein product [Closterium sp. Yama58-4]|nr:unnamed protein product [Closterium sp. Yama58-4]
MFSASRGTSEQRSGAHNETRVEVTSVTEALLKLWGKVAPSETHMDLDGVYLTDAALSQLASFRSLTSLSPSWSDGFKPEGLTQLFSLTGLTYLDLSDTDATDASLEGIGSLKVLSTLNLGNTEVTDAGIAKLRGMTALVTLALNDCESVTSASMVHVGQLTALESLWLCDIVVREVGLKHLTALTSLKHLSLPPGVTDSTLKHLRNMPRLEKLGLWDANITADGVKWVNVPAQEP